MMTLYRQSQIESILTGQHTLSAHKKKLTARKSVVHNSNQTSALDKGMEVEPSKNIFKSAYNESQMKSASQLQTLPFRASNHIKLKPLKTKQQRTALEMQAMELLKLVQNVK